jgi:hypothetical protein
MEGDIICPAGMPAPLTSHERFAELCVKTAAAIVKEDIRKRLTKVRNACGTNTALFSIWFAASFALANLDTPLYYNQNKPYIIKWLNQLWV